MTIVQEMERYEQREIHQETQVKPEKNGIQKPRKKGFQEGGGERYEIIGDFDKKSFGGTQGKSLTGVGLKENFRNKIQNIRYRQAFRAVARGTSESKEGSLIDGRNDSFQQRISNSEGEIDAVEKESSTASNIFKQARGDSGRL